MILCSECGKENKEAFQCECGSRAFTVGKSLVFENDTVKCGCGSINFDTLEEVELKNYHIITARCSCSEVIFFETYLN